MSRFPALRSVALAVSVHALSASVCAQITSPPNAGGQEGAGGFDELFVGSSFRFAQLEPEFGPQVVSSITIRRDGLAGDEPNATARSYTVDVFLGVADPAVANGQPVSVFNDLYLDVNQRWQALDGVLISLPSYVTTPAPPITIQFPPGREYTHPSNAALVVEISGVLQTPVSSSGGPYTIDADQQQVVGRKGPASGCMILGYGAAQLSSTMQATRSGYAWSLSGNLGGNRAVGMMVGDGQGTGPASPCQPAPLFAGGNVSFFALGVTTAGGQIQNTISLPPLVSLERAVFYMQAVVPEASLPLGVALSNGVAQAMPVAFDTYGTFTVFARSNSAGFGSVVPQQGILMEFQ